jgi:hypothetical protein
MSDRAEPRHSGFRYARMLPLAPLARPAPGAARAAPMMPPGEGWTRRFVADLARADEALEIYRGLGLESVACPAGAGDLPEGCDDCEQASGFWVVYTRAAVADSAPAAWRGRGA